MKSSFYQPKRMKQNSAEENQGRLGSNIKCYRYRKKYRKNRPEDSMRIWQRC